MMNVWKRTLIDLSSAGRVMASWRLNSGVNFFMFVPSHEAMGEETITRESDVRFEEIIYIDILINVPLGALSVSNNIERCCAVLEGKVDVTISHIPEGIRVIAQP